MSDLEQQTTVSTDGCPKCKDPDAEILSTRGVLKTISGLIPVRCMNPKCNHDFYFNPRPIITQPDLSSDDVQLLLEKRH